MLQRGLIVSLLVIFQHQQSTEARKTKWLVVPDRTFEGGFEPVGGNTTREHEEQMQGRNLFLGLNLGLGLNVGGNKDEPKEEFFNRIFHGHDFSDEGIGSLIRDGEDLNQKFGIGRLETTILIENRSKQGLQVKVRCISGTKDSGYFLVKFPNGYILKFIDPQSPDNKKNAGGGGLFSAPVTPKPSPRWVCEYKDIDSEKRIVMDAFGGRAPKDFINFYEIRDQGVIRMDSKTGKIDANQQRASWKSSINQNS